MSASKKIISKQLDLFLDMIAMSELGVALIGKSDDGYNVLVGSTYKNVMLFDSYDDHPNIYNKETNSTAAGRYQILHRYWLAYKGLLNLPDFSPRSQDLIAIQLIKECKAVQLIEDGKISEAIHACSSRWASLPGATYGQHVNDVGALVNYYKWEGGVVV